MKIIRSKTITEQIEDLHGKVARAESQIEYIKARILYYKNRMLMLKKLNK